MEDDFYANHERHIASCQDLLAAAYWHLAAALDSTVRLLGMPEISCIER